MSRHISDSLQNPFSTTKPQVFSELGAFLWDKDIGVFVILI